MRGMPADSPVSKRIRVVLAVDSGFTIAGIALNAVPGIGEGQGLCVSETHAENASNDGEALP